MVPFSTSHNNLSSSHQEYNETSMPITPKNLGGQTILSNHDSNENMSNKRIIGCPSKNSEGQLKIKCTSNNEDIIGITYNISNAKTINKKNPLKFINNI